MTKIATLSQPQAGWPFIGYDEHGRAIIAGTTMRVAFLVQERDAHGWSPEEIYFQHSDLSLAQIYSAFGYYYAHQKHVAQEIAAETQNIRRLQSELEDIGAGFPAQTFRQQLEQKPLRV